MQLWPAKENAFAASFVAASSISASASTTTGVALPSSRFTRFFDRALADLPADARGAGERDQLHALVLDDDVADLGGGPDEDVEPARGEPGLGLELAEQEGGERGMPGGLQHDGTAGGERGGDLVRDEVEREVEWGDGADDPDRHTHRVSDLPDPRGGSVHRDDLAREAARLDRGHRVGGHGSLGLDPGGLHRLSGLGGDRLRDLVVSLLQERGHAVEDCGALVGGKGELIARSAASSAFRACSGPARATRATVSPE